MVDGVIVDGAMMLDVGEHPYRPRNSQPVFGGLVDELVRLGIRQPVG
jgi:hypothetical protein